MHHSCPPWSWDQPLCSGLAYLLKAFWPHSSPKSLEKDRTVFALWMETLSFCKQNRGRWAFYLLGGRKDYFVLCRCWGSMVWGFHLWHNTSQPAPSRGMALVHTGWWCSLSKLGRKNTNLLNIECTRLGLGTLYIQLRKLLTIVHIKTHVKQW